MSTNTIQQPLTGNYSLSTFVALLLLDRKMTERGLVPNHPLINSLRNSDYNDFVANGFKYLFIFNLTLEDYLANTFDSIKKTQLISYDQVALNYFTPLMGTNKSILTFGSILANPLLCVKRPIQNHATGAPLGEWINSVVNGLSQIVTSNPHNMEDVDYYQPRFYLSTYTVLSPSTNQETTKTSVIMVMKYKNLATNTDCVCLAGTGLIQIIAN